MAARRLSSFAYRQGKQWGLFSLFGARRAAILRDAAARGYTFAYPVEKSGQEEFEFEYGDDFAKHIEAFNPTFCKVLVRYNPEGDKSLNLRQAARLKRLSEDLHAESRSRFMFELR